MEERRPAPQPRTSGVQVIARAAEILRLLQRDADGLTLAQIAREVGLARSTVHRIVAALQDERLVASGPPSGRIRLGPGLMELAASVRGDLRRHIRPYLEQLSHTINETVDLAVLDGDAVLFVDQVTAPNRLQAMSAIGARFPLHCTANGKAILAALPPERAERLLPPRLLALTPSTVTSRAPLLEEIERVRTTRVAFDREEHTVGICAVGAAIRSATGELGAVTIPLPSMRFYGNEQFLARVLLATCDQINERLEALESIRNW